MSTTSWVAREMTEPDLGDARLNKRLITLLEQLAAQPSASLPQACGTCKDTKAAYGFLDAAKVTPQAIRDAHYEQLYRRLLPPQRILALTDTTDLHLSSKPQMQGVGPLGATEQHGLKAHSVLLASDVGVPLGLAHQQVWARHPATKGQGKNWRKRDLADKESRKWLTALQKTEWTLVENRRVVLVGDREADMSPLFVAPRRANTDLLVRCAYDRCIEAEAHTLRAALALAPVARCARPCTDNPYALWQRSRILAPVARTRTLAPVARTRTLAPVARTRTLAPVARTRTLALRSREGKPAREAVLAVGFTSVTLVPPAYYKGAYASVTRQVVEAYETAPPAGTEWKRMKQPRPQEQTRCTGFCSQLARYRMWRARVRVWIGTRTAG